MEDVVVVIIACVALFLIGILPIGLFIWVYSLSNKVNRLQKAVNALQRGVVASSQNSSVQSASMVAANGATVPAGFATGSQVAGQPAGFATGSQIAGQPVVSSSIDPLATRREPSWTAPSAHDTDLDAPFEQPAQKIPYGLVVREQGAEEEDAPAQVLASEFKEAPFASRKEPSASKEAPSASKDASSESDMTGFMLGNLFNKLGALVVIVAVGIFVKLIAPYVFFNAWIKLIVGYLAGFSCLGAGLALRTNEKFRSYAEVLVGLGLAVNFIITYCSCTVFELWSAHIALLIATVLLVIVYALAVYMRRPSMLVLGLVAGYANLFLGHNVSDVFISAYVLLLNAMTLMVIFRSRKWLPVASVNLVLSLVVLSGCDGPDGSTALIVFKCLGLWLLYVCFDIVRYSRGIWNTSDNTCSYINFFVLSCFTGAQAYLCSSSLNAVAGCLLVICFAYALLAMVYGKLAPDVSKAHINMSLLALLASLETLDWGMGRSILLVLAAWVLAGRAALKSRLNLANWSVAYLLAALGPLLDFETLKYPLCRWSECPSLTQLYLVQWGWPALGFAGACMIFRTRAQEEKYGLYHLVFRLLAWTLVYVAASFEINGFVEQPDSRWHENLLLAFYNYVILMSLYSIQWYLVGKRVQRTWVRGLAYFVYVVAALTLAGGLFANLFSTGRSFLPFISMRCLSVVLFGVVSTLFYRGTQKRVFVYIVAFFGFLGLHLEARALAEYTTSYVVTGAWLVYAAALVLVGMFRSQKDCTRSGIAVTLATVGRLFLVDAVDLAGIYKLLLFLAVGGALMGLSFFYTKLSASAKQ